MLMMMLHKRYLLPKRKHGCGKRGLFQPAFGRQLQLAGDFSSDRSCLERFHSNVIGDTDQLPSAL